MCEKVKGNVLAIVPARGGSKGVPRKNIRLVYDKPMIGWTIEEAIKSQYINRVVVTTDDAEIAQVGEKFSAEVIMRPPELAMDTSPTIDAIFHVLDTLKTVGYVPDYIVLLQPTSPLRTAQNIDEAVLDLIGQSEKFDSLVSVTKLEHPPEWNRMIDNEGKLEDFIQYDKDRLSRRQDLREAYRLNGSIYIIKESLIHQYKRFETERTLAYIMDPISSIDIDTEEDLNFAEYLMGKRNV